MSQAAVQRSPERDTGLLALVAVDVVGYSRLVGADEAGTLARVKAHRVELAEPLIAEHHGRVVRLTGDGALVEFGSAVDAVECAVAIQNGMAEREAAQPEEQRIRYGIGINIGDIISEDGDIYGEGVNIAARLEALAEPQGICLSSDAYRQVRKLAFDFDDMGECKVKNIAEPIRVFRLRCVSTTEAPETPAPLRRGLALPDKPSIAVLPFENLSGDPEQQYFSDGITEDIITELSRFRDLFVISRNSAFVYKNRAVRIQEVAAEFGVQYVVEGSVRKAGNRVRVTVQLIDAESDRHVWAERYDRELEDLFAIQDEVTAAIVATLPGRVEAATHDRAERKTPDNMAAYECVLAGRVLHHRSTREDNAAALAMLERAIALDPKYAHAHAWKGCVLGQAWVHGWCADRDATFQRVAEELQIALALDENDSDVHRILAALNLLRGDHERSRYHQERALRLNPNNDLIVVQQGELLTWLGRPEEGIEWIRKAMRLNPYHPERYWSHLGRAYFVAQRYAEALEAFARISRPDHTHHAFMAAACAQMGDETGARAHAAEVTSRQPEFAVDAYLETLHYKRESDRAHHRESLLKAGLTP